MSAPSPDSPPPTPHARPPLWATLVATSCGAGFMPGMPGHTGTLTAVALAWGLSHVGAWAFGLALFFIVAVGTVASEVWGLATGVPDDQRIVIDEVAGYLATLMFVPRTLPNLVVAFFVFRTLDVWKPGPIRRADEALTGGIGVMADDILAGVIGAFVMIALHYSGAIPVGGGAGPSVTLAQMKRVRPFPLAELPRVARAQVEAARLLMTRLPLDAGSEWAAACRAAGGAVTLALGEIYALPARELAAQARGAVVRLALPGQRWALVVVEAALAARLARAALGIEDTELAAPRPLTLAEEGALEFLVAALAGPEVPVTGILGESGVVALTGSLGDGWLAVAQVRVSSPVGQGWARLVVPDALRLGAPPVRPLEALLPRADRLADAQLSLRLEVGRTAVARSDLSGLGAGDVILFERFGVRDARGGPVTLRLGRGGFAARLDGDTLAILQPYRLNPGVSTMDYDPSQKPDATSADQLLRELPVEVVCELGRVTMSGRELIELRPGAVIPAGRPLSGPVDLTVGGRVVARGELVDVEGEIGVRIVQLCE